jgi:hypothetical protein
MVTEEKIKLAARLYKCRDSVKSLFGKEWKKEISFHTNLIKACMKKHSISNEIKAAMKLIDDCKHMDGSGMFTVKILAAAIEIVEPSN